MEKFKIRASNEKRIDNNIINIIPDIISSDIPYYTEIETTHKTVANLRNKYLANNERKKKFTINKNELKIEIKIGVKSGRVYEIRINKDIALKQLQNILNDFLRNTIAVNTRKKSRYYNNVKFSTEILKILNNEFENRCITKAIRNAGDIDK